MMAEEDVQEQQEEQEEQSQATQKKSMLPWILLGIIVPVCAGGGFFLGRMFASSQQEVVEEEVVEEDNEPDYVKLLNDSKSAENTWTFDVLPIVANLNDPGARRYLRASFTLEMTGQFDPVAGKALMDGKVHLINNWLGKFFSDFGVSDLQGERNLRSAETRIRDGLNEILFPDVKPLIVNALFNERAIQ